MVDGLIQRGWQLITRSALAGPYRPLHAPVPRLPRAQQVADGAEQQSARSRCSCPHESTSETTHVVHAGRVPIGVVICCATPGARQPGQADGRPVGPARPMLGVVQDDAALLVQCGGWQQGAWLRSGAAGGGAPDGVWAAQCTLQPAAVTQWQPNAPPGPGAHLVHTHVA